MISILTHQTKNITLGISNGTSALGQYTSGMTSKPPHHTPQNNPSPQQYFTETFPQIHQNFIKTVKITYIVRNFPLSFHQNATNAANALLCTNNRQNMRQQLFSTVDSWSQLGDPEEYFLNLAVKSDGSEFDFSSCYSSQQFQNVIDNDIDMANAAQIDGAPGLAINNKIYLGTIPYETLKLIIEQEISN